MQSNEPTPLPQSPRRPADDRPADDRTDDERYQRYAETIDRLRRVWPPPSWWRRFRDRWFLPLSGFAVAVVLALKISRPPETMFPVDFHFWPFLFAVGLARWCDGKRGAVLVWMVLVVAELLFEYKAVLDFNWPVLAWLSLALAGLGLALVASEDGGWGASRPPWVRRRRGAIGLRQIARAARARLLSMSQLENP